MIYLLGEPPYQTDTMFAYEAHSLVEESIHFPENRFEPPQVTTAEFAGTALE